MIHFLGDAARDVLDVTLAQIKWHQDEANRLGAAAFNVACILAGVPEDERDGYYLTLVDDKLALVRAKEVEQDEGKTG